MFDEQFANMVPLSWPCSGDLIFWRLKVQICSNTQSYSDVCKYNSYPTISYLAIYVNTISLLFIDCVYPMLCLWYAMCNEPFHRSVRHHECCLRYLSRRYRIYIYIYNGKSQFLIGKPSINGPFPMAMLNNQRVIIYIYIDLYLLGVHGAFTLKKLAGFVILWPMFAGSDASWCWLHHPFLGHILFVSTSYFCFCGPRVVLFHILS